MQYASITILGTVAITSLSTLGSLWLEDLEFDPADDDGYEDDDNSNHELHPISGFASSWEILMMWFAMHMSLDLGRVAVGEMVLILSSFVLVWP